MYTTLSRSNRLGDRLSFIILVLATCALTGRQADGATTPRVRVPDGFQVSLYADDDLAHDIYSMTVDSLGRVVVAGRGYVRILIDSDRDGRADSFKQFADSPKSGAQGLVFDKRDLIYTGDHGVFRYQDRDGDDRADGPPQLLMKMRAGGEHNAHSVQLGPDGRWYVMAGNQTGIDRTFATLPSSPVRDPHAGTLLRFNVDFSKSEILADGFRNAYDFAFHPSGDIFTYDSDGERDVSLPWYQPTRVFQVLPGANAGWVTASWKRPGYYFDMPPVIAEFGRGSPTGVACYRHRQFPEKYRGALFVLDWTFGRVFALPLKSDGSTWASEPISFMTGKGEFGFAPTDVAIGPNGELFVSVGGRGTRGGVFRVSYSQARTQFPKPAKSSRQRRVASLQEQLSMCLDAPQPLSSWSRSRWIPVAEKLGRNSFATAALNEQFTAQQRVRAIEILTEQYGGVDESLLLKLSRSSSHEVRARAVWSYGCNEDFSASSQSLLPCLRDAHPLVVRSALEALFAEPAEKSLFAEEVSSEFDSLFEALSPLVGHEDRFVRQTMSRIVSRLSLNSRSRFDQPANRNIASRQLTIGHGTVDRTQAVNIPVLARAAAVVGGDHSPGTKLNAVRLMQRALGDMGDNDDQPPVFDSYRSRVDLSKHDDALEPIRRQLARSYPTGNETVDRELSRVLAMLSPEDVSLLDRLLAQITDQSRPDDDIHQLIVAAQIRGNRAKSQRQQIARTLVMLGPKIHSRGWNQDRNWDLRVGEMYRLLVQRDPELPIAVVRHEQFGQLDHVLLARDLRPEHLPEAIAAIVKTNAGSDDETPWTNSFLFLLGKSPDPEHRDLVREQFEHFALRGAVLIVLAENPTEIDRSKFVAGLDSSDTDVLNSCVKALSQLPPGDSADEQLALLSTLRRLGSTKEGFPLRENVVHLLRRNTGESFGFEFGDSGHRPQPDVVAKWTARLRERYPDSVAGIFGSAQDNLRQWQHRLAEVDWTGGDEQRGKTLFTKRACAQCHGDRRALGPDLSGISKRFSRDDLFAAIWDPNRDVSPRYRTTLIQTSMGKSYTGIIVYEAADGLLMRNATNQTFRINSEDMEFRRKLATSLMPVGLLKDLTSPELADLYAYLSRLGTKNSTTETSSDGSPRQTR